MGLLRGEFDDNDKRALKNKRVHPIHINEKPGKKDNWERRQGHALGCSLRESCWRTWSFPPVARAFAPSPHPPRNEQKTRQSWYPGEGQQTTTKEVYNEERKGGGVSARPKRQAVFFWFAQAKVATV
jgi:hypothetical protein